MTSLTASDLTRVPTVRIVTFRVLTTITLTLFAFSVPNLLTPWVHVDFQNDGVIQGWRDAVEGTADTLIWVAILGLMLKPMKRPVIPQLLIAGALVATSVIPAAGLLMLISISLVLLPVLSYPRLRLLGDLRTPELDLPGMVIAGIAAAVLLPLALAAWSSTDSQAATYAEHLVMLAVAGLCGSTRRPGWRWIAWPTTAAWAYLGIVALAFPSDLDSFGRLGGIACLMVSGAFAVAHLRTPNPKSYPAHIPASTIPVDQLP